MAKTRTCSLCGRPDSRWYVVKRGGTLVCRDAGMCWLRQEMHALPPMPTVEEERQRVQARRDRKMAEIRAWLAQDD